MKEKDSDFSNDLDDDANTICLVILNKRKQIENGHVMWPQTAEEENESDQEAEKLQEEF